MKTLCLALVSGLWVACAQQPSGTASGCAGASVGDLVDLRGQQVYRDAALGQLEPPAASYGLLLNSESSPYRVLRTDGRIVWSKDLSRCERPLVRGVTDLIAVSNRPLSQEGEAGFEWQDLPLDTPAEIVGFSTESHGMFPISFKHQGRLLPDSAIDVQLSWPQAEIRAGSSHYWASLDDLKFQSSTPVSVSGLLQGPFIPLAGTAAPVIATGTAITYQDFTDEIVSREKTVLPQADLVQLIVLEQPSAGLPAAIGLFSAPGNCSLIAPVSVVGDGSYFGYCKHAEAGPTPLILHYEISTSGGYVDLDVLEVWGDSAEPVRYRLSLQKGGLQVARIAR
jgi:hypothetical protein